MKKLLLIAVMLLSVFAGCTVNVTDSEAEPPLKFNESVIYGERLADYLLTLGYDDTLTVNIHLRSLDHDGLVIKQNIEKDYGIPVNVCNAIAGRNYEKTDPYAKEWYEENRADTDPSFANNLDGARFAYEKYYEELLADARQEYYEDIVKEMPFRGSVELEKSTYNVYEYTATAKELSELSFHERVSLIFPWTQSPVEPPESVKPETLFTKYFGKLKLTVAFDKSEYKYGDTVNMQVTVCNEGKDSVILYPICETGQGKVGDPDYVNGFLYIRSDFYADGEPRRDLTCCYGYDASTDDVKPALELKPGETMGKTCAITPHRSYEFLGDGAGKSSEWMVKICFSVHGEEGAEDISYEVILPRLDRTK